MSGLKFIDDRQSIQRSALPISIGSPANTTLDVLFSTIDSAMVNITGNQTISGIKTFSAAGTAVIINNNLLVSGVIGIGSVNTAYALNISRTMTTPTSYGVVSGPAFSSAVTTGQELYAGGSYAAAGATRYGLFVDAPSITGSITSQAGIAVHALSTATNNTSILFGTTTIPGGNFGLYQGDANPNRLGGALTVASSIDATGGNISTTLNASNQALTVRINNTSATNSSSTQSQLLLLNDASQGLRAFLTPSTYTGASQATGGPTGKQGIIYTDTAAYPLVLGTAGKAGIIIDGTTQASTFAASIAMRGATSGTFTQQASAVTTPYTVSWPAAQGGTNTILQNDGTGVLSWSQASSSGGSKNYLTTYIASTSSNTPNTGNGNFETGTTTGWTRGITGTLTNGIPTGTPTFGSGANGNFSISTVTSGNQIAGIYSLSYASTTASTTGDMVASNAFFIDSEDQAKVLTVKFYYKLVSGAANTNFSGTSSNSFGWAAYDVTNSAWLGVAGQFNLLQNTGSGYTTGTFQTAINTTQIRFVFYNVNASAGAFTLYLDDISVGPETAPIGAAVSDWVAYTPTFVGFGTPSLVSFWSRRVGDSLEFRGSFTSGTATAVTASISLGYNGGNANVTTDSTKALGTIVGQVAINTASATTFAWGAIANPSSSVVNLGIQTSSTSYASPATGTGLGASGVIVEIYGLVPISGWSSNTLMSNDTDTRVVSANLYRTAGQGGQALTAITQKIQLGGVNEDTHGSYDSVTNYRYTIPVAGDYEFTTNFSFSTIGANGSISIALYKNGSPLQTGILPLLTASTSTGGAFIFKDKASSGDYYEIFASPTTTVTLLSTATINGGSTWMIKRLSGPATIAATEDVNCKYRGTSISFPAAPGTLTGISTKVYDSHNAFSSSTFTAPVSGKYKVYANFGFTSLSVVPGANYSLVILKNGSIDQRVDGYSYVTTTAGVTAFIGGSDTVLANAGDTIAFQGQFSISGVGQTTTNDPDDNFITIERVGNY